MVVKAHMKLVCPVMLNFKLFWISQLLILSNFSRSGFPRYLGLVSVHTWSVLE